MSAVLLRQILRTIAFGLCLAACPQWSAHAQQSADDEEARVHFRLGTAYYESGRFAQAATEYQKAYDLSQRPGLLFNIFLAQRDAGEIAEAAKALRMFLELDPDAPDKEKLQARLATLEKMLASQSSEPEPAEEPTETPPGPAPEPQAQPETDAQAQTEPEPAAKVDDGPGLVPWVVIGGGGALIAGGVVSGLLARADEQALEDACPDGRCSAADLEKADSGKTKALVADILMGAGIATAAVGVVFLFWQPWKSNERASVRFGCVPGGCQAGVAGRF